MRSWIGLVLSVVRVAAALLLLVYCWADVPAMQVRQQLQALPDYDYLAEGTALLQQLRFSEALLVVEAGLDGTEDAYTRARLQGLRADIIAARDAWGRRLRDLGSGALTGTGDSMEALTGAVVADLFVFGDLRDLVIQSGRAARGEEADEVIVGLSAAGLALTAIPAADLGTAVLKFARRVGALSESFARSLLRIARRALDERRFGPLLEVSQDAASLSQRAGAAPAMAILKNVDEAGDLRRATVFSAQPGGAFALWLGGKPVLAGLKASGDSGHALWLRAARKGRAGLDFAAEHATLLLRPHPFVGLLKGLYKGNVPGLLQQALLRHAEYLLALCIAWLSFETVLLGSRAWRLQCRRLQRRPQLADEPPPSRLQMPPTA